MELVTGDGDWRKLLSKGRDGYKAGVFNLNTILDMHSRWRGAFRFNQFANCVDVVKPMPWRRPQGEPFNEADAAELAAWFGDPANFDIGCKSGQVLESVETVARRHAYNPLVEYLDSLTWDRQVRIPTLFSDYFGATWSRYVDRVAHIFLVSAVARAYEPGCQVDTMIVFEGGQGTGKTSAMRELFGESYYAATKENPSSKEFYLCLQGRWCIEIEEMDAFSSSKAEVSKVKAAVSQRTDHFRPPYGRMARTFPRQCIFTGTTNEDHYLRDATGARRFLPLKAPAVKVSALRQARDQLWAEAVHLFKERHDYWTLPEEAGAEQEARFQADSWEERLAQWIHGPPKESSEGWPPRVDDQGDPLNQGAWLARELGPEGEVTLMRWVTTTEVLHYGLGIVDMVRHGKAEQMRVASIMKRLGYSQRQVGPARQRRWVRDATIANNLTDPEQPRVNDL